MCDRILPNKKPGGTMKRALSFVLVLGAAFSLAVVRLRPQDPRPQNRPQKVHADVDGLALTPPMGWYPWNIFGEEPQNETLIKEIVDALVASGLKEAGSCYVGPDEGICFSRGPDGKLTPDPAAGTTRT
jgi:hypothetical protein